MCAQLSLKHEGQLSSTFKILCDKYSVADSKILKTGEEERKTMYRPPPVVIYRKCTQPTMRLLYGKRRLFEKKNYEPIGGDRPSPFESATANTYFETAAD